VRLRQQCTDLDGEVSELDAENSRLHAALIKAEEKCSSQERELKSVWHEKDKLQAALVDARAPNTVVGAAVVEEMKVALGAAASVAAHNECKRLDAERKASDLEAEIDELKHQLTVAKALVDQTQKRFIDVYTANTNTNTSSISLIGKSFSSQTSSFVL